MFTMAEKEAAALKIQHAIDVVCSFLLPYLPLANAHNTDFIVDQKWTTYLCSGIATELGLLDEQALIHLPSANIEVLEAQLNSIDIKNDGTFQKMDGGMTQMICPFDPSSPHKPKWNKDLKPKWNHDNLRKFLFDACQCKLPSLDVLTDIKSLQARWESEGKDRVFVDKFMSVKKCHEIDLMMELCHLMAKSHGIDSIVDIGSGRGYLGCHLALMYKYKVLGIDSSDGNTHSAEKRTTQLQKQWRGLVKNATSESKQKKKGKLTKQLNGQGNDARSTDDTNVVKNNPSNSDVVSHPPTFVPITHFVTTDTNLPQMLINNFTSPCNEYSKEVPRIPVLGDDKPCCDGDETTRSCDTCDANTSTIDQSPASEQFMMTGLHTCGNLALSLLQLFVANPSALLVCNVGCCYNHIDEAYLRNPFLSEDEPDPSPEGFPISKYLRSKGCQLGRNARMLAVQAPDRIAHEQKLPSKSIFWRALLQVILRDITGEVKDNWNVGKIGAKCTSFLEYVRKGLKKLKVDTSLSDDDIVSYEEKYVGEERKMNLFFQLRACLSPSIEAVILLDRILYLLEQPAVKEAHIVQLFDPVKSPRCYAIVAIKEK